MSRADPLEGQRTIPDSTLHPLRPNSPNHELLITARTAPRATRYCGRSGTVTDYNGITCCRFAISVVQEVAEFIRARLGQDKDESPLPYPPCIEVINILLVPGSGSIYTDPIFCAVRIRRSSELHRDRTARSA